MTSFGDIKIFRSREDFSLESRHLICIANRDYINKNAIILFYKKSDKKDKIIYEVFNKVGNTLKILNLNFISCAVDQIPGLEKTFQEIANDPDHPYNWIKNKPKNEESESSRFPFMIVYRKGFPQCFYEGPIEEKEFRDFCIQTAVKSDFTHNLAVSSDEIVKQQWMEYRVKPKEEPKGKAVVDALLNMTDYSDKGLLSSFLPFNSKK
jgi:hypothetical protein